MDSTYVLKPAIIGRVPQLHISKNQYNSIVLANERIIASYEIELSFELLFRSYAEVEKFIATSLVDNMLGRNRSAKSFRENQWDFTRLFANWLAGVSFWHNISRARIIKICGRDGTVKEFDKVERRFRESNFEYAIAFSLRNLSQHGGFPVTGSRSRASWDKDFENLGFSNGFYLNYDRVSDFFERNDLGRRNRNRITMGKIIREKTGDGVVDLKIVIRKSMSQMSELLEEIRALYRGRLESSIQVIEGEIARYQSEHPEQSLLGLSAMLIDERGIVVDKSKIISVRDEFIGLANDLSIKNSVRNLKNIQKRFISNH